MRYYLIDKVTQSVKWKMGGNANTGSTVLAIANAADRFFAQHLHLFGHFTASPDHSHRPWRTRVATISLQGSTVKAEVHPSKAMRSWRRQPPTLPLISLDGCQ